MNLVIGSLGIVLTLAASLTGSLSIVVGLKKSRQRLRTVGAKYAWLAFAGMAISTFAMQRALITRDFSVKYVAEQGSSLTPPLYNIATMWSALEGSILLWGLILAGYLAIVAKKFSARLSDPMVSWALITIFLVTAFFSLLMLGPANPFESFNPPPGYDGPGPNPLLQNHILVAFHPPILYLGYVGFTVPFAFAVAALVTGRLGEGWLLITRRWTLFSWACLTFGIILGAWWAYDVLGWGGYWGWDPVENASLLPWLTGTAFLHSVLVQERRGLLRVWNLSLVCSTFLLTILGTFITRSGIIASVHAFSEGGIGPWLLWFFSLVLLIVLALIFWRGDRLRSQGGIDSVLSREGAFLANNLAFGAFAFVILLGTIFPLIVEATQNRQISVGAPYFDKMSMPIGFVILFLMAIAPILPWRKARPDLLKDRVEWPAWGGALALVLAVLTGARGFIPLLGFGFAGFAGTSALRHLALSVRRNKISGIIGRSNGGMIVHLGVVLLSIGLIASSSYVSQASYTLEPGQTIKFGDSDVTYVSAEQITYSNRIQEKVKITVGGDILEPSVERFTASGQLVPSPTTKSTSTKDIQVALLDPPEENDQSIVIQITKQPLLVWIWIGGFVMLLGSILSAIPSRKKRQVINKLDNNQQSNERIEK